MNLFDVSGVVLIAVDDKFTLENPDGIEVKRGTVHYQFLNKYYNDESRYKSEIKKAVDDRDMDTEIHIPIDDKIFVLFAYTSQGDKNDYDVEMNYRRALLPIEDSIEKVLQYCKKNFPNEIIHTVPIGMGVENERTSIDGQGYANTFNDRINKLYSIAESIGVTIEIVEIEPLMGSLNLHASIK